MNVTNEEFEDREQGVEMLIAQSHRLATTYGQSVELIMTAQLIVTLERIHDRLGVGD